MILTLSVPGWKERHRWKEGHLSEGRQGIRSEITWTVTKFLGGLRWEGRMDIVRIHTGMHVFWELAGRS